MEPIERVRIRSREGDADIERADQLAVEEPLEIRVRGNATPPVRFVVTMRTPGHDEELTTGLLLSEGVLVERSDLIALDRLADPRIESELRANVIVATLGAAALARALDATRGTVMGSACGVCGKTSIENVIPRDAAPIAGDVRITPEVLFALPDRLRASQSVFTATGGLHAAALFRPDGELLHMREDIGRHNATDKLVGARFLAGALPLARDVLLVSGRAGFEIVQKAFGAGVPIVASVSAPSSLAVELAEASGITLVGFLRGRRFNVYSHPVRVTAR
jgi:FdhD protein